MTDASTCEVCGKKDWRVADGVCRECAPVVSDLNTRRERGLISNIDDAAPPGDRIEVTPWSGGSDTVPSAPSLSPSRCMGTAARTGP